MSSTKTIDRVYVAGPFSDQDTMQVFANMRKGVRLCSELLDFGLTPFCPWIDYLMLIACPDNLNNLNRRRMLDYSLKWLEVCDTLLIDTDTWGQDWRSSRGTTAEWRKAEELKIKIYWSSEKLISDYTAMKFGKLDWVNPRFR